MPSRAGNTGNRNAPIPKNCSVTSETKAPTTPIQLRAAWVPVRTEALFSEGSSGEYEASARKRRSAETHNRKPTSSFSRRLPVGTKMLARKCMWAVSHTGRKSVPWRKSARASSLCQEGRAAAMAEFGRSVQLASRQNAVPEGGFPGVSGTVGKPTTLLEMPQIRQGDHDDAKHDSVDDKYPQAIGLQVSNEPGDCRVTDECRDDDPNQERGVHSGGQALLAKLVRF